MIFCKRGRPDIQPAIVFLSTRVQEPNEKDWSKIARLLKYLTVDEVLILEADNNQTICYYVDVACAAHTDMKSHTGAVITMVFRQYFHCPTNRKIIHAVQLRLNSLWCMT